MCDRKRCSGGAIHVQAAIQPPQSAGSHSSYTDLKPARGLSTWWGACGTARIALGLWFQRVQGVVFSCAQPAPEIGNKPLTTHPPTQRRLLRLDSARGAVAHAVEHAHLALFHRGLLGADALLNGRLLRRGTNWSNSLLSGRRGGRVRDFAAGANPALGG